MRRLGWCAAGRGVCVSGYYLAAKRAEKLYLYIGHLSWEKEIDPS
jgi:hypothetical protein